MCVLTGDYDILDDLIDLTGEKVRLSVTYSVNLSILPSTYFYIYRLINKLTIVLRD